MSIFASLPAPDDEGHEEDCGIWIKNGDLWSMRGRGFCTCGQPDAPLKYQGSHVLPSDNDARGGYVDVALIPPHITRDGRDRPEDGRPWPFLRLGVNDERVILTRRNVEQIAASLADWLQRTAAPEPRREEATGMTERSSMCAGVCEIEFYYGLKLRREAGGWRFTDPTWIKTGGSGASWLALTPFETLDQAVAAAERVLPVLESAWKAAGEQSRTKQAYYSEAMAASRGR